MKRFKILVISLLLIISQAIPSYAAQTRVRYGRGWFDVTIDRSDISDSYYVYPSGENDGADYSNVDIPCLPWQKAPYYSVTYASGFGYAGPYVSSKPYQDDHYRVYWINQYENHPTPPGIIQLTATSHCPSNCPKQVYIYINHPSHNIQTRSFTKGVDLL